MKGEEGTQQEAPKDEKQGIKSYSPPLSPLVFPQTTTTTITKSPSLSPSSSSSSLSPSPLHDSQEIFHTNDFRLTPPPQEDDHTKFEPPPPQPATAAQDKDQDGHPEAAHQEVNNKRSLKPYLSILKRSRRQSMVRRALLGLRISGILFCLISFSVMAADKKKGWALDSFSNYKEFRYCLAVNVLAFVYSGFQTYDLAYYFSTGKHVVQHHLRFYFDFLMDQILTYLVISASSSAATRVEDWESNWGKDKFPDMARASVALSFLAFFTFASCSLISGYTLCTVKSM